MKNAYSMFQTLMIMGMYITFLSIQKEFFFLKEHDDESLNNTIEKEILDFRRKRKEGKREIRKENIRRKREGENRKRR